MSSPRLKSGCQESALIFTRLLSFIVVLLIVGLISWITAGVAGAPLGFAAAIGGMIAGVAGFGMLIFGNFFNVKVFTCPHCGHTDRTLQDIGYYNCFNCGTRYQITKESICELDA
ncbi:MAG: transcription elongation factor 1 family protein [Firmicutes bacterium]|nr:transcription elongation factor 1 family protein [Bacillota bacterium]